MRTPWRIKWENDNLLRSMEQLKRANDDLWQSKDELENEVLTLRKRINDAVALINHADDLGGHAGREELLAILSPRWKRRNM